MRIQEIIWILKIILYGGKYSPILCSCEGKSFYLVGLSHWFSKCVLGTRGVPPKPFKVTSRSNYFYNNTKILFTFFSLTSRKWMLSEAAWHMILQQIECKSRYENPDSLLLRQTLKKFVKMYNSATILIKSLFCSMSLSFIKYAIYINMYWVYD